MGKRLFYFRPGEEARMLARFQFGVDADGRCGALITYPIKGFPWRRNVMKSVEFALTESQKAMVFEEVYRLRSEHPGECLSNEELWSDSSEKANGITRDRATNTLCVTIAIYGDGGETYENFSMREDSGALLNSPLYKLITQLVEPYEKSPSSPSGLTPHSS
jgi:hypothetical protein